MLVIVRFVFADIMTVFEIAMSVVFFCDLLHEDEGPYHSMCRREEQIRTFSVRVTWSAMQIIFLV